MRPKLELRALTHIFGSKNGRTVTAFENLDLAIPDRKFVSILGPSGCGKSTIFNVVAGLLTPSRGDIYLDGEKITGMVGFVGYMLQKDLLLPWRTVLDNVILGMELPGNFQGRGTLEGAALSRALRPRRLRDAISGGPLRRDAPARGAPANVAL